MQRFSKITAGFVGGYAVAMTSHMAIANFTNHVNVMITLAYTGFILWAILFIVAFLARNGWKIWLTYLSLTAVSTAIVLIGKQYQPLI